MPSLICTVTNDLSQDQRMIRICTSLQRAGYTVTLVGRERHDSRPLPVREFQQHRLPCWRTQGKMFYLEYNLRLLYYLLRKKPDIINAVDLDTLLPGYLVARWLGITCVYDAHEYFTEVPEVVRRPLIQKIWSALANWIIPHLRYAYTVGPSLARIMSERYGTPFGLVRNVPMRRKLTDTLRKAEPEKIILYQGMLNEGRGLEAAILAIQRIRTRTTHKTVLYLAGYGDVEDELRRLVTLHDLHDYVHFLGFIPPDELPQLTSKAWLGLNLLANTGLSYYYSLANKTFDYIQAGLPALHADFPEYRALNERYDIFVLANDLKATTIASAIESLLENPQRYAQLAANNRTAAEELTWENEEEELLRIYKNL